MSRSLHIRIAAACLAALLAMTLVPAPARAADVEAQAITTFTVRGTGFGHGIGLSQYGSQGSALAGKSYTWILAQYYTGTTLGTATKTVRVKIDAAATPSNDGFTRLSWRILSGQPGTTIKINGVTQAAGTHTFSVSGSSIVVTAPSGAKATYTGTVTVTPSGGSPPLLQVVEGSGIYSLPNTRYRGQIELSVANGRMKAVNVLPMDSYMYGVVPREMPSGWHAEALKAQAVAARSYAYASSGELYCTTRSQAYQGFGGYNSSGQWVGETNATTAAVNQTKDQVLRYGGSVIRAYYSSHSGGHTANNEDVWVGGSPLPWARGVPDPYESRANPPYAPWPADKEKTYTGLQMADRLRGLTGVPASPTTVIGTTTDRAVSGHVRYVTFRFSNGATATVSGDTVRSRLGLLSTNFYFTGFPIERIAGSNRYDTAADIARKAFPATAPAVVIASGEDFADALTGSALAGAAGGPLLLTAATRLPAETSGALGTLKPATVYVMGGETAVGNQVVSAIAAALPSAEVTRVAGVDRYQTARRAAETVRALAGGDVAIVANSTSWADAAAASALAYAQKTPILLTSADKLGEQAAGFLSADKPGTALVVGGPTVVSDAAFNAVAAATGTQPRRLSGANRYETAAAVARYTLGDPVFFTYDQVYIATGVEYADALTGGVLAGVRRKPLLLTYTDSCPAGTAGFLTERRNGIGTIYLFGGPAAISDKGLSAIDQVMMR